MTFGELAKHFRSGKATPMQWQEICNFMGTSFMSTPAEARTEAMKQIDARDPDDESWFELPEEPGIIARLTGATPPPHIPPPPTAPEPPTPPTPAGRRVMGLSRPELQMEIRGNRAILTWQQDPLADMTLVYEHDGWNEPVHIANEERYPRYVVEGFQPGNGYQIKFWSRTHGYSEESTVRWTPENTGGNQPPMPAPRPLREQRQEGQVIPRTPPQHGDDHGHDHDAAHTAPHVEATKPSGTGQKMSLLEQITKALFTNERP
jgi:hypothetical protein